MGEENEQPVLLLRKGSHVSVNAKSKILSNKSCRMQSFRRFALSVGLIRQSEYT